ncbi:DUF5666 domain-containing protein [Paraburkholderia bonniea]|uniref:DUF5666 domain-containing protein n=1 Tax=Paraburkholderia bonniea TaxID=2152891 RepID=UPI0012910D93|nr:DUF5666 domain-containing protein [Paraburkholderia bonniea]
MTFASGRFIRPFTAALALASAFFVISPASAQNTTPTGVRGTITALAGDTLSVRTKAGKEVAVKLAADTAVRGVSLDKIENIKSGSYIGAASIPQADGTLKALEVHVFPPSLRGSGEGHRAWDLGKNSTMTNGTVGDLVVSNGRTITVKYPNGEKKIVVPADVPIVSLTLGDRSLLRPGTHVVLFAQKSADGSLVAKFISAGKDGIVPPM